MSSWTISFSESAENDIAILDKPVRQRIVVALERFAENFNTIVPLALGGNWKGFFKLRAGDWRIIYTYQYDKNEIVVCYIDHRSKIYRRRKR